MVQEHHIAAPDGVAQAVAWAMAHGWQAVLALATPTEGGGAQGGVAIFARRGLAALGPPYYPHSRPR